MQSTTTVILIGFGTFIAWAARRFLNGLKKVNYIPGYRVLLSPITILGAVLPGCSWNLGRNWSWMNKDSAYFNFSHDIISMVPVLNGEAYLYTCSVDVLKQLLGNENKTQLIKPAELTSERIWGHSLASASGDLWRKHRRAVTPAFHSTLYTNVRSETALVYQEMLDTEGWTTKSEIFVPDVKDIIAKAVLVILGRCGFGLPMPWPKGDHVDVDPGKEMSLVDAIRHSAATFTVKVIVPRWFYKLPIKSIKDTGIAWDTMRSTTEQFVLHQRSNAKTNEDSGEDGYILRRLIAASSEDSRKYLLSEKETVANMFTLLFAGHETTASTLTAALGFLAIYQEEQDKAYQEILDFITKNGKIDIKQMETVPHLFGCFLEAGRRYPAPFFLPRAFTEDTAVKVKRPREETIILPKGCTIILDIVSIFNNPLDFPEPHVFKPSRWYGVSESDTLMFGTGPRNCVGRKFALTKSLNLLAHILHDWKLDIELKPGETREGYEKRVMGTAGFDGTAFSVERFGLKFIRRAGLL